MTVIIRLRNGLSVPFQAMATINNLFSIGILGTFFIYIWKQRCGNGITIKRINI